MLRQFLKVYFFFICVLILTFTFADVDDGSPNELLDYIDWIFTLITLSGVFAYCFLKPFLTPKFWQVYLPVLIVWDLFFMSKTFIDDPNLLSEELSFGALIVLILSVICLLLPGYIALYLLPKEFETKDTFEMEA